jgi:hypothetical protein
MNALLREIIDYPCDYVSECDDCHNHGPLWGDIETEGCGDFAYCADCWRRSTTWQQRKADSRLALDTKGGA